MSDEDQNVSSDTSLAGSSSSAGDPGVGDQETTKELAQGGHKKIKLSDEAEESGSSVIKVEVEFERIYSCSPEMKTEDETNKKDDDYNFAKPKSPVAKGKVKETTTSQPEIVTNNDEPIDNIYNDPQPSTSGSNTFTFYVSSESTPAISITVPQQTNPNIIPGPSSSSENLKLGPSDGNTSPDKDIPEGMNRRKRVNLYAPDTGPQMYNARGNLVTPPIITKNLPKVFQYLPIYGKPDPDTTLAEFYRNKIREFVGCGLTDTEFKKLEHICGSAHLTTKNELILEDNVQIPGLQSSSIVHNNFKQPDNEVDHNLVVVAKYRSRVQRDPKNIFNKKLKYRGVRILSYGQLEKECSESDDAFPFLGPSQPGTSTKPNEELEPGSDVLYRVRVYRPYTYSMAKDRHTRSRHSVFTYDVLLSGRHALSALRDRFVCHNDFDMRVDVSNQLNMVPITTAKEVFPSGFLFINNVFYVDYRRGCIDYSAPIREWANKKGIGNFPVKDMCQVKLEDLVLKLGYPEVYVHQGNCEHVFIFSDVRLLNPSDPLLKHKYPCTTAIAQNQTVYCTTCAEFSAKWIVVGSDRVPFNPGFFCEICFKQYMYKDGQKIGNFKAYRYRGNALNMLRKQ